MASYNKFTPAIENLFENINAGSDSWVVKLATAVDQTAGTITEVANGNGYTTGGNACTTTSSTQSGRFFVPLRCAGRFDHRYERGLLGLWQFAGRGRW